jgi:leader peptidase (prepilin peptidase)/N-methyltransferase
VELAGAVVAVICILHFGVSVEALLAMIFGWTLLALGVIDLETGYLPDALTLPLIAGGVAFNTVDLFTPWPMSLLGAAAGYVVFRFISWAYLILRKQEGLGGGDATLLSAIGAWGGVMILPVVVFIGALATLVVIGLSRLLGRGTNTEPRSVDDTLPFGPGLALAGFVAFLWLRTF